MCLSIEDWIRSIFSYYSSKQAVETRYAYRTQTVQWNDTVNVLPTPTPTCIYTRSILHIDKYRQMLGQGMHTYLYAVGYECEWDGEPSSTRAT